MEINLTEEKAKLALERWDRFVVGVQNAEDMRPEEYAAIRLVLEAIREALEKKEKGQV